jgi:hypothetical protein
MPETIFDALAIAAQRREDEFQRVLDEMQVLVTTPQRSQSAATDREEPAARVHRTLLVDHQVQD